MTKLSNNVTEIEKEIQDGDFNLNLKEHILYLPSFIDSDICKDVVSNLKNIGLDKSTPYTDGLLNDHTDSYYDPDIATTEDIKKKVVLVCSSKQMWADPPNSDGNYKKNVDAINNPVI